MILQTATETDGPERLLLGVAKGDKSALARLFATEAGRLLAVARRVVRRPDLAEEVVQDTFVIVWTRARQFDPKKGSARGWLTRIARNRALNLMRDTARLETVDARTLEALGDRRGEADTAYKTLPERHALRLCLDALDPARRDSILLCYVTGLSHGEVAATLGAPLGTAKAWIRRGMQSLRDCLG